jgi:REP element-mobilizing transposase RayT
LIPLAFSGEHLSVSGENFDHRKDWIPDRLRELASVFAIEVCGYSVMSNHFHVILRIHPDIAEMWTDVEIARRWLHLCPPRGETTGKRTQPHEHDVNMTTSTPESVGELRGRLTSLSWFMRNVDEPIARAANAEDNCTGRFWEGRFKSRELLDDAAVLACSVYVDLNPVRAGINTPPAIHQSPPHPKIAD